MAAGRKLLLQRFFLGHFYRVAGDQRIEHRRRRTVGISGRRQSRRFDRVVPFQHQACRPGRTSVVDWINGIADAWSDSPDCQHTDKKGSTAVRQTVMEQFRQAVTFCPDRKSVFQREGAKLGAMEEFAAQPAKAAAVAPHICRRIFLLERIHQIVVARVRVSLVGRVG